MEAKKGETDSSRNFLPVCLLNLRDSGKADREGSKVTIKSVGQKRHTPDKAMTLGDGVEVREPKNRVWDYHILSKDMKCRMEALDQSVEVSIRP